MGLAMQIPWVSCTEKQQEILQHKEDHYLPNLKQLLDSNRISSKLLIKKQDLDPNLYLKLSLKRSKSKNKRILWKITCIKLHLKWDHLQKLCKKIKLKSTKHMAKFLHIWTSTTRYAMKQFKLKSKENCTMPPSHPVWELCPMKSGWKHLEICNRLLKILVIHLKECLLQVLDVLWR